MLMAAQPGMHDTPVPVQIYQLATTLHNILMQDEEFNAPVLERLRADPNQDRAPSTRPWTMAELSRLCSHLVISATEMARAASRVEFGSERGISDDDDGL